MSDSAGVLSFLADVLHREKCSCVIWKNYKLSLFHQRGVKDLLCLLNSSDAELSDALVADKVVGKGAAALMILGGIKAVYADVISIPALNLLNDAHIQVEYANVVRNIINRAGTGVCPVEKLCEGCHTAIDCLPLIKEFVNKQQ